MKWERYVAWVSELPFVFCLPLFVWTIVLPTAVAIIATIVLPIAASLWLWRQLP